MESTSYILQFPARKFIDHCKSKFGWSDLSKDVVMDVGCGEHGYCGKSMLEKFPELRAVIFIDNKPQIARDFKKNCNIGYECVIADIEKRDSLRSFEGRMTKVVSTRVFHQLVEKEEAFRNVYHLLKPGGEAALLFIIKPLLYEWLAEMQKKPRWKEVSKSHYVPDLYRSGLDTSQYVEMVENIGFQVVECSEENRVIPVESDERFKEALYKTCRPDYEVSPELVEEFKEESLQVYLKYSERDKQGRPCYRSTELSLLLIKPAEVPGSAKKDNIVS